MVATPRERLDPSASCPAPDLEPSEGEQDECYDERTDRVLDGDVSGARLEPREKRGKATRWNEPVHGGDGKKQDAKKSSDQRQGPVHRADVRADRKFSVTRPREDQGRPPFLAALAQLVRLRRKKDGGDHRIPSIPSMDLPSASATLIIVLSRGALAFPFSHRCRVELQRPACRATARSSQFAARGRSHASVARTPPQCRSLSSLLKRARLFVEPRVTRVNSANVTLFFRRLLPIPEGR